MGPSQCHMSLAHNRRPLSPWRANQYFKYVYPIPKTCQTKKTSLTHNQCSTGFTMRRLTLTICTFYVPFGPAAEPKCREEKPIYLLTFKKKFPKKKKNLL